MQIRIRLIDNFAFISHHIRPDIPKPRISIVTRKSKDKRITMMPFAPGIPELYDCFVASSIKHNIKLDIKFYGGESEFYGGEFELYGVYPVWNVSKMMIQDLETELGLSQEPSKPFPLVREVMQRSIPTDKNNANMEHLCSNYQSKSLEKPDAKASGWKMPGGVEVGMGAAAGAILENVVENDAKADRENGSGKHNHVGVGGGCSMDTSSEGQTIKEPTLWRDEDILMNIAEKVVEVVEMCAEVNKVMGRKNKKRTKGINEMQTNQKQAAMMDMYVNKQKENKVDDNNAGNRSKTSDTSGLYSTDGVLSIPQIFSTTMDEIGPKFKSQPKIYGQHKSETGRNDEGNDEAGMKTAMFIDSRSEQEPNIQHMIRVDGGLMTAAETVKGVSEQLRAKRNKAGKGLKQRREMILEDLITDNDKNKLKGKNKKKILFNQFMAFAKSDPDATLKHQDDSQIRAESMPSPLVNTSCVRPVQYNNDMGSDSTPEQDLQSTSDRTNSTIWTPDESSLRSYKSFPDITTEKAFSKTTPHEAIQLAILEIVKEVARGL
jgi:hypothetical protein